MKELKRDLQSVAKTLKALKQKTEGIVKKLDKLDKAQASGPKRRASVKTARKKATRRLKKVTAIDTVLSIIKKRKKGIDTSTLKMKTGFNDKKIWNIINSLKKQGKLKSEKKGVYMMV